MSKTSIYNGSRLAAAIFFLSIASVACSGGDDDDGGNPTPTPGLDISITDYFTQTGDENVNYGECVGFTITDGGPGGNFDEDTELFMIDPSLPVDPDDETAQDFTIALTVANNFIGVSADGDSVTLGGDPLVENYPCVTLPLDENGFWVANAGVRIAANGDSAIIENALSATAPTYTPLSYPAATAGSFEQTAAFDAYNFTAVSGTFNYVLALSANSALQPTTAIYTDDFTENYFGFDIAFVPSSIGAPYRYTARDAFFNGGAGFDYSLTLNSTGTLTVNPSPADTCGAAAQGITTGKTIDFVALNTGLTADYDPAGAAGCADRFATPGSGVDAPGPDAVYQVIVPNGQTIRVAAAGGATDVTMMLVTLGNCVATPTTCKAAADINGKLDGDPANGGSGTDSLIYRNTTGSSETLYLILDDFTAAGDSGNVVILIDIR